MALPPDTASLLLLEIGKEFRFYNNVLLTCGLYYVGKTSISLSMSIFKGIREHIWFKLYPTQELTSVFGKWAVVSGATQKMGKAYVEELSRRGMNIILLDRDSDALQKLSSKIESEFGNNTHYLVVDFLNGSIGRDVQDLLHAYDIGILVNSFQEPQIPPTPFMIMKIEDINNLISSNVTCMTLLSRYVIPGMLHRNRGIILNMLNFSGLWPIPYITTYSACKAYMDFFSRALNMECHGTNVRVQTIVTRATKEEEHRKSMEYLFPSLTSVCRNSIDTLLLPHRITGFWFWSFQLWLAKHIPTSVLQWIVYETMATATAAVI